MFAKYLSMGVAAVAAMLAVSCGKSATTGNDVIVESFPVEAKVTAADGQVLELPSIGILDMNIFDDMLIVSTTATQDSWQIYSLPGVDSVGSVLSMGQGPGELTAPPISIQASYFRRASDGHKMALIPSFLTLKFVVADLTASTSGDTAINIPKTIHSLMAFRLDDNRWLTSEIVPDSCKIRRTIFDSDGNAIANSALDKFNTAVVSDMSQLPQLIRFPHIKPDGEWVADQRGYYGIIDVWNTRTGESFQIIYPEYDNSVDRIKSRVRNIESLFQGGAAFDDFFVMQRINDDGSSNMDFFAWDGTPLGTLHIEGTGLRRVDFDLTNGDMYCLDAEIDQIIKYPVGDFLSKLKH